MYRENFDINQRVKQTHAGNFDTHRGGEESFSFDDIHVEKVERYFASSYDSTRAHKYPVAARNRKRYEEM